jgi:preprotein translocase subunit SecG
MDKKVIEADEIIVPKDQNPSVKKSTVGGGKKSNLFSNSSPLLILAGVVLLLVVLFLIYSVLFASPYKYSFNISGVDFVSNESTPSEFFNAFNDNNSFVVSVDVVNNASNAWVVNSMNLWLIALNADKKEAILIVKNVNSNGDINNCLTNDANVLESRELSSTECKLILNDESKGQIVILLSNKDEVLMEKNKVTIFASGTKTISYVNYYVIKEMYTNFDDILAIINEKINSIK